MNAATNVQRLGELPLFAGLEASELGDLERHLVVEEHSRGACLFRRGDPGDALYVVLHGQVALEIPERRTLLGLAGPGDWFGELALLTGMPRSADARVTLDADLLRVGLEAWRRLAERSPRVFARLSERLGRALAARTEVAPARRTVVACGTSDDDAMGWIDALATSVRHQVPRRALRVLGRAGSTPTASDLAAVLAREVATDAVVLVPASAIALADRHLTRHGAREWRLVSTGGGPVQCIRGSTADEALARAARYVAGAAVGLALGAGGAFGLSHVGLLEALARAGIPVDVVAGSSIGAIIGAVAAARLPLDHVRAYAERLATGVRGLVLRDLDLRGRSLLTGASVRRILEGIGGLDEVAFEDLSLPLAVVAMDVATGDQVVIDSGPLLDGLAASYAMPGIFPACERDGRSLVDGAMVNPVPVDRARGLGADVVIAAQPIPALEPNVTDPLAHLLGRASRLGDLLPLYRLRQQLALLTTTLRSFQALWFQLACGTALAADVCVRPDLRGFWFLQFGAAPQLIEAGRLAAEAEMPAIRGALMDRVGLAVDVPRGAAA